MSNYTAQELRTLIHEVIAEVRADCQSTCPVTGVDTEKINLLMNMPTGAFKMLGLTWRLFESVGTACGKAITVGLFVLVLAILYLGGSMIYRVVTMFGGNH